MPNELEERAREMDLRLRAHSIGLLEYKRYDPGSRSDMTNADAVSYGEFLEEVRQLLLAFTQEAGWMPIEQAGNICAEMLETAIGNGYPAPANKVDQCGHGKFGWEDCIACYDEALQKVADEMRKLPLPAPPQA